VLVTNLTETLTLDLVQSLASLSTPVTFDGVYCLIDPLHNSTPVCYNQIYLDFGVIHLKPSPLDGPQICSSKLSNLVDLDNENNILEFTPNIEKEVLLVAAIQLSDSEIVRCPKDH